VQSTDVIASKCKSFMMTRVEDNLTPLTYLGLIRLVNPLIRVYKVNSLYRCSRVNHTFRQKLMMTSEETTDDSATRSCAIFTAVEITSNIFYTQHI